jgi:hypothetical protein
MIKLFGFNITGEERRILNGVLEYLARREVEIIDLWSEDPDILSSDVVLAFGDKACKICRQHKCRILETFPEPTKISSDFGDREEHAQAVARLELLKKRLDSSQSIDANKYNNSVGQQDSCTFTEEDLPEVSAEQILRQLETIISKKKQKEWILYTRNGKTVRITMQPEEGMADINLTFAELLALKTAMETLQAKELEIVYKSANKRNNTQ